MKQLIVGLGNPGFRYRNTRHNAGFMYVDAIAESAGLKFHKDKKFNAEVAEGNALILVKPLTFMNNSGQAVRSIKDYYNIEDHAVVVAHDDSDIEFGNYKIQKGRGSAGHRGINSINEHLGTLDYERIRIGVRTPGNTQKAETFVLKRFNKNEREQLKKLYSQIEI